MSESFFSDVTTKASSVEIDAGLHREKSNAFRSRTNTNSSKKYLLIYAAKYIVVPVKFLNYEV